MIVHTESIEIQNQTVNRSTLFRLLSGSILFLFLIQVITLAISLLQIRIGAWTARGILGTSLVIALVPLFLNNGVMDFRVLWKRLRRWQTPFLAFLVLAGLTYLILWAAACIMPDLSYDGNTYHIPTLALWDIRGYIHWINTSYLETILNGYPKGAELLSYVLVKAFSNSVINTANLVFLPLGIFGIALIARLLGANRWLSACAGAAFILIPANINQSVTTYVDSAFASSMIGLLATLLYVANSKGWRWSSVFLFGAAMGLTLSTKSTGIAMAGLALLVMLGVWFADLFQFAKSQNTYPSWKRKLIQRLFLLFVAGVIATICGGYWYIRNMVMTGTPLYPVGLTVMGLTIFPGASISSAVAESQMIPTQLQNLSPVFRVLFTWAQGLGAWPVSIKGYDSRIAGLGFLWALACLPSIIISLISFHRFSPGQRKSLLILVIFTGLGFAITPMNWWARFTIWIYALGLPSFALILTCSAFNPSGRVWPRRIASLWMAICLSVLVFEAAYCTIDVVALASPGQLRSNIANAFKPGSWSWPTCYLFPDMQGTAIEAVLTQPGMVGIGPHGNMEFWRYAGLVGQLSQPIGFRQLFFLPESPDLSQLDRLANMKTVLWDQTLPLPSSLASRATSVTSAAGFLVLRFP